MIKKRPAPFEAGLPPTKPGGGGVGEFLPTAHFPDGVDHFSKINGAFLALFRMGGILSVFQRPHTAPIDQKILKKGDLIPGEEWPNPPGGIFADLFGIGTHVVILPNTRWLRCLLKFPDAVY